MPGAKVVVEEAGAMTQVLLESGQPEDRGLPPLLGATSAWLLDAMARPLSGYAITAKPSANLYILMQARFAVRFLFLSSEA